MPMNCFAKLPLRIRFSVVLSFLVASIVVGILGHPSPTLLLASALLLLSGGWRISKARSFVLVLIFIPAIVGLLLTHFDWHHPFFTRYSAGLFSVIAALLLMDGIRIEEWIQMVQGKRKGLSFAGLGPLLIGTAVGTISLSANIQEQRTCRKLARIDSWRAKSRMSIFLDSIALPFYNAVESHEFIDEALHRWSIPDADRVPGGASGFTAAPELIFGNSSFTARLSDLKDFPRFREVRAAVLSAVPMPEPWKKAMSQLAKPARILEIGDHARQFAKYLVEKGFDVTVLADQDAFGSTFHGSPQTAASFKVSEARPEETPIPQCNHLFLHHNSFLEEVNRVGVRTLLSGLYELSNADTHILFDYPVRIVAPVQGVIFSGHINNVGAVEFRYSRHEHDHEVHKVQLAYAVRQEHESFCVRVPLRFVAPELDRVLAVAHEIGFLSSTSPVAGASFCLPGEFALVELHRPEVLRQ